MAYLKITPGVSSLSDTGRPLSADVYKIPDALKESVLARDDHTCCYCGFQAKKYQDVHFTGSDTVAKLDNYVTACAFCAQCFQLDKIERMQSGAVIWLPEIGQAALHHICRAIYVARISRGPMADAARDAMEALLQRKAEAVTRLGTDSPRMLASILQDFLEAKEYKQRVGKLKGFRILPLDRRIIREGDLEFNQFPQVLAFWRSKDGPFGDLPPRDWGGMFFTTQEKIKQAG